MKTTQNKLSTYLAVTAGVGCAVSVANAGVIFYGPGARNSSSTPPTPSGLTFDSGGGYYYLNGGASFMASAGPTAYFTRGEDLVDRGYGTGGPVYKNNSSNTYGAVLGSDQNYANISFNGSDSVYEAVVQFFLDGSGGGYLIAIATNDAPNAADALSISAGKSLINAAAVPEPSSLALLALGSAGLIARRKRRN